MVRAHVVVHGRVQGVSYRAYAQQQAVRLGLRGWIRNAKDGTVEAVFEGSKEPVEAIVAWCHRGSPLAQVTRVVVAWEDPDGEGPFQVRR
ncbi:MAG: acylphosphatase [Alphaproteobacteria bacterium]|nr:acylphosphatase [Alphaproteobacteria bacterium]